jgi:prepilin-type processing-associated H-X9-DG protein
MASEWSGGVFYAHKYTKIRNPVNKIMLAEEPASDTAKDMPDESVYSMTSQPIDDGRWQPGQPGIGFNTLSIRHRGNGDVAFADGHVQPVKWTTVILSTNSINPYSN